MKIKRINSQADECWFSFACSGCGRDVDRGDVFCKHCGKKLELLPHSVKMQKASEIMTLGLRGNTDAEVLSEDGVQTTTEEEKTTSERITHFDEEGVLDTSRTTCIGGRTSPNGCPHLGIQDACTRVVCPSYPPKYPVCRFCGSGFVDTQSLRN